MDGAITRLRDAKVWEQALHDRLLKLADGDDETTASEYVQDRVRIERARRREAGYL
jgi:hypothetical protein